MFSKLSDCIDVKKKEKRVLALAVILQKIDLDLCYKETIYGLRKQHMT